MSRGRVAAMAGVVVLAAAATVAAEAHPTAARRSAAVRLPVFPAPQSIELGGGAVSITPTVRLVTTPETDQSALDVVRRALRAQGATLRSAPGKGRLTIVVGRDRGLERSLGAPDARGLDAGGYVLAAGRMKSGATVVLDGADGAGQFYAAQTLRQLLEARGSVPVGVIRDWPSFPSRGIVEGFYGKPWSQSARLAALDFLGRHKANVYMYLPKDDVSVRSSWRSPMTSQSLAGVRTLVTRATRNHITFNYGVSPGDSICYSSPDDREALRAKLTSLQEVGVDSFTLAFDDIDATRSPCASDKSLYGTGPEALAMAQATLVASIEKVIHSPLVVVPTEYSGYAGTPYQRTLASLLPPDIAVQWTGRATVSPTITAQEAAGAGAVYAHPLLLWDNAFINDLLPGYLVLGPYAGREAAIASAAGGITVNPMNEPEASRLGLFTMTDFAWNATAYNRARSWSAAIREVAGPDPDANRALKTFASANYGSPLADSQSPVLSGAIARFWPKWNAGAPDAANELQALFAQLRDAPATIRERVQDRAFVDDTALWLDATERWGTAASAALDLLLARKAGDSARAAADEELARSMREQATLMNVPGTTPPASVRVAGGTLVDFVHYALRGYGP